MRTFDNTIANRSLQFRIAVGKLIEEFGLSLQPNYWKCTHCGDIKYQEEEIICWTCGLGEMLYKGK